MDVKTARNGHVYLLPKGTIENVNADFMTREGADHNEPPPQTLTVAKIASNDNEEIDFQKMCETYEESCDEDIDTQYRVKTRDCRRKPSGKIAAARVRVDYEGPRLNDSAAMWNFDSLSQVRLLQPSLDPTVEILKRIEPEEFARQSLDDPILAFLDYYKSNNEFGDQLPHNHPNLKEIKEWVKAVAPHAIKNPDGSWEMEKVVTRSLGIYERVRIRLVPQNLTNEVIRTCHNNGLAGHQSKQRTYEMLKEGYSWPRMRTQIYNFVDSCEVCQSYNMPNISKEVGEYAEPGAPFRVVAFDLIGPLGDKKKKRGFKHIMCVVDMFTRFVFLIPLKSTGSNEIIAGFRDKIIPMVGTPLICLADQEGSFMSQRFKTWCDDTGLLLKPLPQGASNSNGLVERCIRSVQTYLKK